VFQGLRDPMDRPVIYNESNTLFLTIVFGWIPVVIALYLAYININVFFIIILIVARFFILPTIFNNKLKKFMDKKGV
jgi:ABC-type bacteriocin/lantibiotic exporter with double-glycine peptidase domain